MEPDWSKPILHDELAEFETQVRRFYATSSDTALKMVGHIRMLNETIEENMNHTIHELERLSELHQNESIKNTLETLKLRVMAGLKGYNRSDL
jgi:hypothetical protein